ncbi:hypothetical protein AJ79_06531 [Helicocarpus griseus UAMH5409]|uniref:ABM domain-containing protein n=1 Tax=Helicocarpus griseus UAMH5409 TaxID=1447875 RepID=A0A2B7XCD8_9EURO|nr:hypothetical protein AJ79_06531 [Helicocarpus griseus UAMH5409]
MSSNTVTELVYLTFKPGVKPEDPDNADGRVFTNALEAVKLQSGYQHSNWGRTVEDENDIVWIVEWKDTTSSLPLSQITPILSPTSTPISLHTTLQPPLEVSHLTSPSTPIVELAILPFPSSLPFDEKAPLDNALSNLRSTMLNINPDEESVRRQVSSSRKEPVKPAPPRWVSLGWVERPGTVKHAESPTGDAELAVLVAGWESVEEHEAVRGTESFQKAVQPLKEKMLPGIKVLGMRYVTFKKEEQKGE